MSRISLAGVQRHSRQVAECEVGAGQLDPGLGGEVGQCVASVRSLEDDVDDAGLELAGRAGLRCQPGEPDEHELASRLVLTPEPQAASKTALPSTGLKRRMSRCRPRQHCSRHGQHHPLAGTEKITSSTQRDVAPRGATTPEGNPLTILTWSNDR